MQIVKKHVTFVCMINRIQCTIDFISHIELTERLCNDIKYRVYNDMKYRIYNDIKYRIY